ncbi:MAG: hypothetical protein JWO69_1752, partial [Thermoleophilia bacterium]|nr:hypothetical protein [Thermoleophilia bacterium]
MPDAVVRVVATVGREAVHEPLDPGRIVDAASIRIVASALAGDTVDPRALDAACDAFADDPDGVERVTAMVRRATRVLGMPADGDETSGDTLPIDRAVRLAAVQNAILRALGRRHASGEAAYERFAAAVAEVADADGFDDACRRAADALLQLSGMTTAAVYVPGAEHARMVRAAVDSVATAQAGTPDASQGTLDLPTAVRVDRGLFADVVAGERPVFVSQRDTIDAFGARTLIAVPMRDRIGRPVGMLLALDVDQHDLDVAVVESARRLAGVVAGELASAAAMRRSRAALGTLPDLAHVAHADDSDVTSQLEALARIVSRATDSDSAVVRVRDAAGRFLETRAVVSSHGDAVADAIGTRTMLTDDAPVRDGGTSRRKVGERLRNGSTADVLDPSLDLSSPGSHRRPAATGGLRADLDHAEIGVGEHELIGLDGPPLTWSSAGQRTLNELAARSVASFPIDSRFGREAVIYVIRTTARPFDDVDRACIRIVTAHAQHVIDRHVSQQQTLRAINAARSAVRLLGEALVAGVRAERTMRFLPRLFHEMFATEGVRAWRRDRSDAPQLLAGAGVFEADEMSSALATAFDRPLQLELDTTRKPHVAAVAFDIFGDARIGIEIEVGSDRSLGVEEQRLAVDVASRVQEAMYSAG